MQTVLVTGASSGMGKATAVKLIEEVYTVYVAARRLQKMQQLEELGARALEMDISKGEDVQTVVDQITAEQGGIDILINNAGFGTYGAMEDTSLDDARYQFEVNLFGLARLTQLALPYMREKGAGTIVNVSSVGGKIYTPLGSWYHATKHALEGWSDSLRYELKPFGVNVIIIEPWVIRTEFGEVALGPMLERSGGSAYADMTQKVAEAFRRTYARSGSPPSVIANVISKALKARRPKTRYAAGQYARLIITLRRVVSDRMFDRIIQRFAA